MSVTDREGGGSSTDLLLDVGVGGSEKAAQSQEPGLCTSQQIPYRPVYREPETEHTDCYEPGHCQGEREGQK